MTKQVILLLFLLLACICSTGCVPSSQYAAGVIAPTGTDIDKADAYNASAQAATDAATPHTDPTGQSALSIAKVAHKAVASSLLLAKKDLSSVETKIGIQQGTIQSQAARITKDESGWGYRLQVWVSWFWFAFKILVVFAIIAIIFHLIAGPVSMLLPPPWNAIILTAGKWCNPLGWISVILQRMHTNALAATATAPIVISPSQPAVAAITTQVASQAARTS